MTGRLVGAGVKVKRDHVKSVIFRSFNVPAAIRVRYVRVEEFAGHVVEKRNTLGGNADSADMSALLAEVVSLACTRNSVDRRHRGCRYNAKLVPVIHVRVNYRVLVVNRGDVGVAGDVSGGTDANVKRLYRPLDAL